MPLSGLVSAHLSRPCPGSKGQGSSAGADRCRRPDICQSRFARRKGYHTCAGCKSARDLGARRHGKSLKFQSPAGSHHGATLHSEVSVHVAGSWRSNGRQFFYQPASRCPLIKPAHEGKASRASVRYTTLLDTITRLHGSRILPCLGVGKLEICWPVVLKLHELT